MEPSETVQFPPKQPSKLDVAVLLIFFCREQQFARTFAAVKQARPARLYLYQDGARPGRADDAAGVAACRKIALDIDWECEVHTFFQEKNVGCDPSEFIAQKWMFETEEMGIILEDDDVAAQSFFPFCAQLLQKYRDDERIHMICGMNQLGVYEECPYDYFFTKTGSIWGWATWRRVTDTWQEHYDALDDPYVRAKLLEHADERYFHNSVLAVSEAHRATGRAHYESINGLNQHLYSRLNIVPRMNMISNIGIAAESTHAVSDLRLLPKSVRGVMFMQTHELTFPLKEPPYVMEDVAYRKKLDRIFGSYPGGQLWLRIQRVALRLRYGDFRGLWKKLKR